MAVRQEKDDFRKARAPSARALRLTAQATSRTAEVIREKSRNLLMQKETVCVSRLIQTV
jgi:hypothetical protein